MTHRHRHIIVGISGASGVVYAQRLLDLLDQASVRCHVICTEHARRTIGQELGIGALTAQNLINRNTNNIRFHDNSNLFSNLASGSVRFDGMAICPCSSNTLGAIAAGTAETLLQRTASVTLKQKRSLVLVHREMPLTTIDLENMLRVARAGATICPASPPFYHRPQNIADLVDTVVGRVLDLLDVTHNLAVRWSEPSV